jgi:hypothetical protein
VSRPDDNLFGEDDPRFAIDRSTIPGAGDGLFAKEPLAAGDRLEVIGVLIEANSISDICTTYANRYKFRVGGLLLIPLGYGSLVNDSDSPNMKKVIEDWRVYLEALRPIERGEELFFVYETRPPELGG